MQNEFLDDSVIQFIFPIQKKNRVGFSTFLIG